MSDLPSLSEDRALPVAFSLNGNPGCYVAIVGAGLSSSSDIPLAGNIIEHLCQRVATTQGESPEDPWQWYEETFEETPTYQGLLTTLGPAPGDRQGILRPYFARTPDDQPPTRQPNGGHLGLARLARAGLVKVFITTNFDRLLEEALQESGLNPTTIASEEDLRATPPLDTLEAVVIHIHGEWQRPDTLRNTEDELGDYPDWVQRLLSRTLEGRGYLIVGWSGKYDPALRAALAQNRTGRYSTYWVDLYHPQDAGRELLVDLSGIVLEGDAADVFERVNFTIEVLSSQKAMATSGPALNVARAKRAITTGERPIETMDRLGEIADSIRNLPAIATRDFNGGDEVARQRRAEILNASREAAALTMTLAAFAHAEARRWLNLIRHLAQPPIGIGGTVVLQAQQQLPGTLLLAAAGVGAVAEENWALVDTLLTDVHVTGIVNREAGPLAVTVDLPQTFAGRTSFNAERPEFAHPLTLLHDYLKQVNREAKVFSETVYEEAWERWEYLWHLTAFPESRLGTPRLAVTGTSHAYHPELEPWLERLAISQEGVLTVLSDEQAREDFSSRFADRAQDAAWSTLPSGLVGFLPSGRWRMDEVGRFKVPPTERESWKDFGLGK